MAYDAMSPIGVSWGYLALLLLPVLLGAMGMMVAVHRRHLKPQLLVLLLAAGAAGLWTFFTVGDPVVVPVPQDPQGAECLVDPIGDNPGRVVAWQSDCGQALVTHMAFSAGPTLVMLGALIAVTARRGRERAVPSPYSPASRYGATRVPLSAACRAPSSYSQVRSPRIQRPMSARAPRVSPVTADVPEKAQQISSTLIVAAALAFANLAALMGELIAFVNYDAGSGVGGDLGSMTDVWFRYAVALLIHGTVTGGFLASWPKARLAGLGVLIGTAWAGAVLLVFVLVWG